MPPRLILIDDHKILRDGLRLHLTHGSEFTVVGEAGSADQALRVLASTSADIAIVDLVLPDVDELSLLRQMREHWPELRLVVLTGRSEGRLVEQSLAIGVRAYLRKEIAVQRLREALGEVLAGRVYLCPASTTALAETLRDRQATQARPALSEQEIKLVRGIAAGLSYKEIAIQLGVTPKSAETYRRRLTRRLGLRSRADLVSFATKEGLTDFRPTAT